MMETPNLLSRLHDILNNEPAQPVDPEEQESVSTLYRNNWVRILVVRQIKNPHSFVIDVEVSQPCPSLSSTAPSFSKSEQTSDNVRELLEQLIEHIKYVLMLEYSGFSIDFVGTDCLILAFRSFTEMPNAEIFKLLLPPSST
jgi:hypothetical protein